MGEDDIYLLWKDGVSRHTETLRMVIEVMGGVTGVTVKCQKLGGVVVCSEGRLGLQSC